MKKPFETIKPKINKIPDPVKKVLKFVKFN